jgi:hypothetical protein
MGETAAWTISVARVNVHPRVRQRVALVFTADAAATIMSTSLRHAAAGASAAWEPFTSRRLAQPCITRHPSQQSHLRPSLARARCCAVSFSDLLSPFARCAEVPTNSMTSLVGSTTPTMQVPVSCVARSCSSSSLGAERTGLACCTSRNVPIGTARHHVSPRLKREDTGRNRDTIVLCLKNNYIWLRPQSM